MPLRPTPAASPLPTSPPKTLSFSPHSATKTSHSCTSTTSITAYPPFSASAASNASSSTSAPPQPTASSTSAARPPRGPRTPTVGCWGDRLLIRPPHIPPTAAQSHRLLGRQGDACALPYPDQSFDILFSNSVIEHVGDWERQQAFAHEARRVARKLWIQTPAREFFIEPHYIGLFVHWLPKPWQPFYIRWFTLWGLLHKPSPTEIQVRIDEFRLLSLAEFKSLFPDCTILRERFLGLFTKSYIAYRE